MTIGYAVWLWQRAKAKRGSAEDFVPSKRNSLEDELRSELDAIRGNEANRTDDDDIALDLPRDERERQQRIRALAGDEAEKE